MTGKRWLIDTDRRREEEEALALQPAGDFPADDEAREQWLSSLHERTGLPLDRLGTMLTRYGTRAATVADYLVAEPDEPLQHHDGYSRREIEFIVRHERVEHLDDLVLRHEREAPTGP